MNANVVSFDFEEMARLANEDPEGFAQKRGALIRRLIDNAARTEHLIELQRTLDEVRDRSVVGVPPETHITEMMLQCVSFMTAYWSTLNELLQASPLNNESERNHERALA